MAATLVQKTSVVQQDAGELWRAYQQQRNLQHRNRLVEHYLPLARAISRKAWCKLPRHAVGHPGELLGDATEGLIHAVERFDPERGLKFSTFAGIRIHGAIADCLRNRDWVPRLERQRHGKDVLQMVSLEGTISGDGEWSDRLECLMVRDEVSQADFWKEMLRGLSQRDRVIVLMYWGFGMKMKEVAKNLGVSESRISQLLTSILQRLRQRQPCLV